MQTLFGLQALGPDAAGRVIIVDGVMDVLVLHSVGITNAVASMGRVVFEDQVDELVGIAAEITFASEVHLNPAHGLGIVRVAHQRGLRVSLTAVTPETHIAHAIQAGRAEQVRARLEAPMPVPPETVNA